MLGCPVSEDYGAKACPVLYPFSALDYIPAWLMGVQTNSNEESSSTGSELSKTLFRLVGGVKLTQMPLVLCERMAGLF